ncbi:PREDICTED: long-chain fatty acid transport protein 3 [Nanorana parkeri]|uniref:long-chain fatty acid transport protein 3 n=1 Tax=Nanorana parkeri TaxID=125878 RepID=UPI0008541348|nr:PREDICTED: long-chain fatty acid transport protein 3 [Nanorana parkeri]
MMMEWVLVVALLLSLAVLWPPGARRLALFLHDALFIVRSARLKRTVRRWMQQGALSLPGLFQLQLRSSPDSVFLLFRDQKVTYRQLEESSNRAANALLPSTTPGATVALLLPNEPRFLTAWFALAKLGQIAAFLNTNVRRGALKHCLGASGARGLITSPELFEAVREILPDVREMGVTVWVMGPGDYPDDVINLQALMDAATVSPPPADLSAVKNPMETAICIFTSGTTGLPKAARISHLKTLMCCVFYQLCGANAGDVIYMSLPLYHKSGVLLGVGGCIGVGASLVLKERFSASQFWNDCNKYNVTIFQYIGELCRYLTNQPQTDGEKNHRVRLAAGSGLRPDVWKDFSQRFGKIKIFETYGMTEFNISFFNYTGTPGAIGRGTYLYKQFCPFDLIRFDTQEGEPIRDSQGRCQRTSTGETGLLISPVTTMSPFLGYVGSRELSEGKLLRDVFQKGDCYFNTGDLMAQDNLGFVYFRDRTGDTFRWKGENVATTEVSEILSGLDFFQEVNVYGVTIPGHEGRAGMAAVTVRSDHELNLDRVFSYVMEVLPSYARPRFLRVMEHMETTGTFKQQKQRLVKEGFSPLTISDPLYLLDEGSRSYRSLTEDLYSQILSSEFRV